MGDSAGDRRPRSSRAAAAVGAVALAVIGTTYLAFATEVGYDGRVFRVLRWAAIVAVLGAAVFGDRGALVSASLVLVGVFAIIEGSGVVEAICTGPPAEGWGVDYEWRRNQVYFGPGGIACDGEPNRPVWLGGLFLAGGGVVGLVRGWSWPTDRDALVRALPSIRDLSTVDPRRALASLLGAAVLSHLYLFGQGTWHGVLSWLPLAAVAVWGLAALVAERRASLAGALVASLGFAVLRGAPAVRCEDLTDFGDPAAPFSLRPGSLAIRYAWTGSTDAPFAGTVGWMACRTDFLIPAMLVGTLLVAVGVLLGLRERG